MKKLIFLCLVVLMGSCKDKETEPDIDFATGFSGSYATRTADGASGADHLWNVSTTVKNQLGIAYTKNIAGTISGAQVTITQTYDLVKVVATSLDSFTINEEVTVTQGGLTFKQKVEGVATKVLNSSGIQQLNITLKLTNSTSGVVTQEYLEFKKK